MEAYANDHPNHYLCAATYVVTRPLIPPNVMAWSLRLCDASGSQAGGRITKYDRPISPYEVTGSGLSQGNVLDRAFLPTHLVPIDRLYYDVLRRHGWSDSWPDDAAFVFDATQWQGQLRFFADQDPRKDEFVVAQIGTVEEGSWKFLVADGSFHAALTRERL